MRILAIAIVFFLASPASSETEDPILSGLSAVADVKECGGFVDWIASTAEEGDPLWRTSSHARTFSYSHGRSGNFFMFSNDGYSILRTGLASAGLSSDIADLPAQADACAQVWEERLGNTSFNDKVVPFAYFLYGVHGFDVLGGELDLTMIEVEGYDPSLRDLQLWSERFEGYRTYRGMHLNFIEQVGSAEPPLSLEAYAEVRAAFLNNRIDQARVSRSLDRTFGEVMRTTESRLSREHGARVVRNVLHEAVTGRSIPTAEERHRNQLEFNRLMAEQDARIAFEIAGDIPPADDRSIGNPESISPEDMVAALTVIIQTDMRHDMFTENGARLFHPDQGIIGATGVSGVDNLECDFPEPRSARCRFTGNSFTSINWQQAIGGTPEVTKFFEVLQMNTNRVYDYQDIRLDFGPNGWRLSDFSSEDTIKLTIGELPEPPESTFRPCVAFSIVDILTNC